MILIHADALKRADANAARTAVANALKKATANVPRTAVVNVLKKATATVLKKRAAVTAQNIKTAANAAAPTTKSKL